MIKFDQIIKNFFKKLKDVSFIRSDYPFIDLTPVDNADPDGCYSKALSFAFENPRIKNVAVTGPYGSGKSSIINTYEKNSDYNFLNISLASFKEEDSSSVDTTLVEKSILQQMLYGADANKLPYSRFKRISTPTYSFLKSLLFVSWLLVTAFLYYHRKEIFVIGSEYFFILFTFVFFTFVLLISSVYKASFGLSLKKLSLKNAEIETGEHSEDSILNRHLDEIIYFFQVTDYDVVVIEDLDRFGDPEIFVKLREINKLINDNEKTHNIKFLYALRDDMFAHKKRAKFFDFIIPVVPIINSSNSLDKMQERLKKYDFAENIEVQFLREVSLYIDDLRLIHNIFNELIIYYNRLKSDSLDMTKLLAMMVYKNVYPNDFENLHHGKGALFEICKKKGEYLQKSKGQLKEKINKYRNLIELANTEKVGGIRELIDLYVGHIVSYNAGKAVLGIVFNNNLVGFSQITTFEQFKPLISEQKIQLATHRQNQLHTRVQTNKSFSEIEEEINPDETFLSRKRNIENSVKSKKIELQKKIKLVEVEISELSQKQLFQILQSSDFKLDELINKHKISSGELLVYLVNNGYLDESYHSYISNFHEGRLTNNDRDYLLTIRNFNHPEPNQNIDTPKEVCANMREEDFSQKYVLNVTLIDYLLKNKETNQKYIESAINFISQNFKQSEAFFATYFNTGMYLADFIKYLSLKWPELASVAISSKHEVEFISYILKFVDTKYISEKMNTDNLLTDYLSEQGELTFVSEFQLLDDFNILKILNVHFHDLTSLEKNHSVVEFAHVESLYTITPNNIIYILQKFAVSGSINNIRPETANYTSILSSGSKYLKDYVEENLLDYIEAVFLYLPDNSMESEKTIKTLINNEIINDELKENIILKQEHIFDSFIEIPENLWSYLLLEEKVDISWNNISEYLSSVDSNEEIVTELLTRQSIVDLLSNKRISVKELGDDNSSLLSSFIFNNNKISDSDYCKLIKCLPCHYDSFPTEISNKKIKCLVHDKKVRLNEDSFNDIVHDNHLIADLISKNFDAYLDEKESYPIGDDVRELLLLSEINNTNKIIICLEVTPTGAQESKKLSQLVSNILVSNDINCSEVDDVVLSSAIINAKTVSNSILLLMKCLTTWDEKQTMEILADLPGPFNEIASYGKRPKLDNNEINLKFSRLLVKKGFISSIKEGWGGSIKINTYTSSEHSRNNLEIRI